MSTFILCCSLTLIQNSFLYLFSVLTFYLPRVTVSLPDPKENTSHTVLLQRWVLGYEITDSWVRRESPWHQESFKPRQVLIGPSFCNQAPLADGPFQAPIFTQNKSPPKRKVGLWGTLTYIAKPIVFANVVIIFTVC